MQLFLWQLTVNFSKLKSFMNIISICLSPLNLNSSSIEFKDTRHLKSMNAKNGVKQDWLNNTLSDGSTSWNTISASAIPATTPSSLAKKQASTSVSDGIVAKQVTSPKRSPNYVAQYMTFRKKNTMVIQKSLQILEQSILIKAMERERRASTQTSITGILCKS